jgi:predicted nucleic acid-binding OB-fold protein
MTISSRAALSLSVISFVLGSLLAHASWAGEQDPAALLQALGKTKLTLIDGLKQSTKGAETPISAKFELDDNKQLSLSVYTAEKGLGVDSEHNVLKELSGSPEKAPWTPDTEVFKDLPHVARASQHLTLTAVAEHSLAEIVAKAQKEHPGTVFSIAPTMHDKKPVFAVLVADQGKVSEYLYDAITAALVRAKQ